MHNLNILDVEWISEKKEFNQMFDNFYIRQNKIACFLNNNIDKT